MSHTAPGVDLVCPGGRAQLGMGPGIINMYCVIRPVVELFPGNPEFLWHL